MKFFPRTTKSWIPACAGMTKGFTLIETLFAILIFSAALVSLMTIAGRGISATKSAREQVTAHYLAQEGLEVARNVRDSNFVTPGQWDNGFSQCTDTDPCNIFYGDQTATPTLVACTFGCNVYESTADGAFVDYDPNTTNPSGYRREIRAEVVGTDEYKITTTVTWTSRTILRKVELVTIVKKWQ